MTGIFNLSPRQVRIALDLVTAAMVISVAFALAGLTWRLRGHAGTGAVTVPSGRSAPSGTADIAPALALAPFGKGSGVAADSGQPTGLPLELRGIVAAQPVELSTAFIVVSGQPSAPFHIGQSVGGATIQGIARDRVILNNAGRIEYLAFPDPQRQPPAGGQPAAPGAAPAPAAVPPPPGAPAGAPPPGAGPVSAANISAVLQRFNATPAAGGYRIGANPPAGLIAGDVLLSLNGTALSDSGAAAAAFNSAQSQGFATIVVLRAGKRLTLTVPIR